CADNGTEVSGAVGRSVTFHLQSPDGEAAAWSFRNDVIATVKFGNPPEVTFFDNNYKSRLAFPEDGGALTISQLRMDDAGTYTARTSGGKTKTAFTLHVYRELAVPTVTCVAQNCSVGDCRYTLHCAALGSGYGTVFYSWSVGGLPRSEGPTLLAEELPTDELPLTCTAQNPVSSRNATVVSPAALCAGNSRGKMHGWVAGTGRILHPVAPAFPRALPWRAKRNAEPRHQHRPSLPILSPHSPTPKATREVPGGQRDVGSYFSRQAGIVAASVTVAIVLLAAVIFVIYCKSKGWTIFHLPAAEVVDTEAGAEYMTVYAQVGPSQQMHMESIPNARHGDPKKTPTPDAETSKTIYFSIQAVAQTDDEKMSNSRE
ncbi:PREDICTED: T-lymphocyte surface antigen Ly-9-like, partial [Leptosomus discolor]|uniref:T-lymphocyte surface antigen Ly-9-like n=1 Tax=Leptosomus discolor TaxID=188344 RepID=UPI000522CC3F